MPTFHYQVIDRLQTCDLYYRRDCQSCLVLTIRRKHLTLGSKMSLCRRKIARVALGVPLEDDLYWVMLHQDGCQECLDNIESLRLLSEEQPSMVCIETAALVEIGHSNKCSREESDHLMSCMRCAKIGQFISAMPSETRVDVRPLSLTA